MILRKFVIPAQAGNQSLCKDRPVNKLVSRLRGNDSVGDSEHAQDGPGLLADLDLFRRHSELHRSFVYSTIAGVRARTLPIEMQCLFRGSRRIV